MVMVRMISLPKVHSLLHSKHTAMRVDILQAKTIISVMTAETQEER
jgi:hypothetical protein